MNFLRKILLSFSLICSHFVHSLDSIDIQLRVKKFRKHLESLSWQLSAPWSVIETMALAMGYSQMEIDAIPVSFPFLYEQKYKQQMYKLESTETIVLINQILDAFYEQEGNSLSHGKKSELVHTIIHEFVLEGLGLGSTITTKQLADLVSRKQVSIHRLCEIQIAAFFVKFYLNI